jgi:hypothetical protein
MDELEGQQDRRPALAAVQQQNTQIQQQATRIEE